MDYNLSQFFYLSKKKKKRGLDVCPAAYGELDNPHVRNET